MRNLGLKTLNVAPCFCHHYDVEATEYHQRQYLPHRVAHHWLTYVLVETFLPIMLQYGMVGHYFQGLPLIHCDIPKHFYLGERLF
ncbi:hypothetical protein TNCV_4211461 [Trichonephila clavipes]|nr:hypothetical protein TNCV_4211461 [Trichonephila clavipes]